MLLRVILSRVVFVAYFAVYSLSVGLFFYGCSLINKIRIGSQIRRAVSGVGLLILIGMPPFLGFAAKVLVFLIRRRPGIIACIRGSVVRLKFYIDFFYRIMIKSLVDKVKTSRVIVWGLVTGANFIGAGLILVRFI